MHRLAVSVADEGPREEPPHDPPVGPQVALLELVAVDLAPERPLEQLQVRRQIGGVGDATEVGRQELLARPPEEVAQRAVDRQPSSLQGHDRHPDRRVLEGALEARVGLAQLALAAGALADVAHDGRDAHHATLRVDDGEDRDRDVDERAVLAALADLEVANALAGLHQLVDVGHRREIAVGQQYGDRAPDHLVGSIPV